MLIRLTQKTPETWLGFIFIFLVVLSVDIFVFAHHLHVLYPLGDEFALITESENASWRWLYEGYSKYFNVYPEFFVPYTHFIRPVANAIYWFFSPWTELGYKFQLVIVSYGTHAAISALLYQYSYSVSGNSFRHSFCLALAAFLAPAFWCSPMPLYPSFTLDGLAALLCFLGAITLTTRMAWFGLILLTLAIFTKETALPVLAAVIIYAVLVRRHLLFVAALSVLIFWGGLRLSAFGIAGGTYALNDETWFSMIMRSSGLLRLPVSNTFPGHLMDFFATGKMNGPFVFLLVNLLTLTLFGLLVKNYFSTSILPGKTGRTSFQFDNNNQHVFAILFIGAIFSAIFFSLIAGSVRFSYVFFICLLGVLTVCRPNYYLFAILIVASTISDLHSIRNTLLNTTALDTKFSASRKLVAAIRAIGNIDQPVFIVGDIVSGFSRRDELAKFSGVTTPVLGGISIEIGGCPTRDLQEIITQVEHYGEDGKVLTTKLPQCASFTFESANPDLFNSHLKDGVLNRSNRIQYNFPDKVGDVPEAPENKGLPQLGNVAVINIREGAAIYFDFKNSEWIYVP